MVCLRDVLFGLGDAPSGSYCVGKVTCRIVLFGHSTVRSCCVLVECIFVLCCDGEAANGQVWCGRGALMSSAVL